MALVILFFAAGAFLVDGLGLPSQIVTNVARPLFAFVIIGLVYAWFGRARQHEAPPAEQVLADDPRPPVLYLRCFRDDEVTAAFRGSRTDEEQLAEVLSAVGPVVAIGRPGEALPALGASRMYVPDAEWQSTVARLVEGAALVVLRAGDTKAFWWELERAVRYLPPERVVLLCPVDAAAWREFVRQANGRLPGTLPVDPPTSRSATGLCVLYFTRGWVPAFGEFKRSRLRGPITRPLVAPYTWAFQPVFRQLQVAWSPAPVSPARVGVVIVFAMFLIGPAIGLAIEAGLF